MPGRPWERDCAREPVSVVSVGRTVCGSDGQPVPVLAAKVPVLTTIAAAVHLNGRAWGTKVASRSLLDTSEVD